MCLTLRGALLHQLEDTNRTLTQREPRSWQRRKPFRALLAGENVKFLRTNPRDIIQMFNKSERLNAFELCGRAAEEPGRGSAPGSVVGPGALRMPQRCAADLCDALARRRTPQAPCARRALRPRCRGVLLRTLRAPMARCGRSAAHFTTCAPCFAHWRALRSVRTPSRHGRCAAPGLLGGSGGTCWRLAAPGHTFVRVCFFCIPREGRQISANLLIHKETSVTLKHTATASPPPPPPLLARVRAVSSAARGPLLLRARGDIVRSGCDAPSAPSPAPGLLASLARPFASVRAASARASRPAVGGSV